VVALLLTASFALVAGGAATAYTRLQGNIASADVEVLLGEDRPPPPPEPDPTDPSAGTPVNILVLGSDTREGNEQYASDPVEGERADTTIVVHISADRSRVELVSIPRDTLVDIPECLRSDGTSSRPQTREMFNSAFSIGAQSGEITDGAACTQKTVEALSGLYIHHFVVVDMSGFVKMVDSLNGVPMCIPNDMYSTKAHLDLKAGQQTLDGVTALALARARTGTGLGNGSDTGRIARQQELLAATARQFLSMNLLTDVPELMRFLDATTSSLTVSSGLASIPDLAGMAFSLRSIREDDITFLTIPWEYWVENRNRVVLTEEAPLVWANLIADVPVTTGLVPEETPAPAATPTPGATTTPAPIPTPGVDPFTSADTTSVC